MTGDPVNRAASPERFDVLVLGSGIAGCTTALHLASAGIFRVGLVSKSRLGESTTRWAQGGIAAALSISEDSPDLHLSDTLRAGAGLCDEQACRVLVDEAQARLLELLAIGASFDRDASGALELAREGGHSVARVAHAGGSATGAEVMRALSSAVRQSPVECLEGWFATDFIVRDGHIAGIASLDPSGELVELYADVVVVATGGAGQLFDLTTNPPEATGDGLAMALRAGVAVCDLEFVQFHPTALAVAGHPRPLLSEALRGHGALLVDAANDRFVDELAPRDVVSRAIFARMAEEEGDHVFLDARKLDQFETRFPSLAAILARAGLDASVDLLPVAPAAHYFCGGILSDLDGASALPGLYAVGEVACSGVQGANRLASNSLLEGLVFGARAASAIIGGKTEPTATGALGALLDPEHCPALAVQVLIRDQTEDDIEDKSEDLDRARHVLQVAMTTGAGVLRTKKALSDLRAELGRARRVGERAGGVAGSELSNLATVAIALVQSAIVRAESRGAHFRSDFPERDDVHFACRFAHGETGSHRFPRAV